MKHAAPSLPDVLALALARALEPHRHRPRWWIACSGGVDSMVLLHAVHALTQNRPGPWPALAAIHVNHQLNPHAARWAEHVERFCRERAIACTVRAVDVGDTATHGIEAAARQQRYAVFADALAADELLLQGHHRDDQVETYFLRLLRGSGLRGLRAMPSQRALGRGLLLRPLLDLPRAEILAYADRHALQWVDDDSNADARYDRNFLRQRVLPLLAERWPAYRATVARAALQSAEAAALLQELAVADWRALDDGDEGLPIAGLAQLTALRQRHLLRFWLAQRGLPAPSRAQLDQIMQLVTAVEDAVPCVRWPDAEVRRFRARIYASAPLPPVQDFDLAWSPPLPLALPGASGTLEAVMQAGTGLRSDRVYRVRNRRGGERCHPDARPHSQTLKKLLQEASLAPWLRARVPLIFCGDELAAVGDLWICRGFATSAGMPGWQLLWRRPPL